MMNKNDCKIVQDLLPNYIDKLTTSETNDFIENHLSECKECNSIYENMKKDFETEDIKKQKKVKNFMKKYNKKLRFFKLTVLAIIIIFLLILDRKAIIMSNLIHKANTLKGDSDYLISYSVYNHDEFWRILTLKNGDTFKRELREVSIFYEDMVKIEEYCNGNTSNYYIKVGNTKQAILDAPKEGIIPIELEDYYLGSNSNYFIFIRNILLGNISKETINSSTENYYYLSNIVIPKVGICNTYIEKETGFIRKIFVKKSFCDYIMDGSNIELQYGNYSGYDDEFNEKDINISEYEIIDEQTLENTKVRR